MINAVSRGDALESTGPQGAFSNQHSILNPEWRPKFRAHREGGARVLGADLSSFLKGSAPSDPPNPIGSSWNLNGGGSSGPSPEAGQRSDHQRPLTLQRLRERLELAAIAAGHPHPEQVAALELQEVAL